MLDESKSSPLPVNREFGPRDNMTTVDLDLVRNLPVGMHVSNGVRLLLSSPHQTIILNLLFHAT